MKDHKVKVEDGTLTISPLDRPEGHSCVDGTHKFKLMGEPYYRGTPGPPPSFRFKIPVGEWDQSVEYQRLYCRRCGISIEVIIADHRQPCDEEATLRSEVP